MSGVGARSVAQYDEQMRVYEAAEAKFAIHVDIRVEDPDERGLALLHELFAYIRKEEYRVVEMFFQVDTDGNGHLDRHEFEDGLALMRTRFMSRKQH